MQPKSKVRMIIDAIHNGTITPNNNIFKLVRSTRTATLVAVKHHLHHYKHEPDCDPDGNELPITVDGRTYTYHDYTEFAGYGHVTLIDTETGRQRVWSEADLVAILGTKYPMATWGKYSGRYVFVLRDTSTKEVFELKGADIESVSQ